MTRADRDFVVAVGAVFIVTAVCLVMRPAHAATARKADAQAVTPSATVSVALPPIRIKCPCDMHVTKLDGYVTLSGAGTLTVGPSTTDYTGGHWEGDADISFENHAPAQGKK